MTRTVTNIPEAHGKRWEPLVRILRSLQVTSFDFTGEIKISLNSGGIRSIVKTEVVR